MERERCGKTKYGEVRSRRLQPELLVEQSLYHAKLIARQVWHGLGDYHYLVGIITAVSATEAATVVRVP